MNRSTPDPQLERDLELVYERMRGTVWGADLRDSPPVLAPDIESGAADELAACLELVESDLAALWIATCFGTVDADRYAPVLLRKFPTVQKQAATYAIGDAFRTMVSGGRLEAYVDDVVELLRVPGYDIGAVGLVHALPRMGQRGIGAAVALIGREPKLDEDLIYGLWLARKAVSSELLEIWDADPRPAVRELAARIARPRKPRT